MDKLREYKGPNSMKAFRLIWAPTGKEICVVSARSVTQARRLAPYPWRQYLGEIRAEQVI
jgi:hypothetical protein